jgi:catechol 2,3-dioxygenase-like lactoylglutathione lyase family enzyme
MSGTRLGKPRTSLWRRPDRAVPEDVGIPAARRYLERMTDFESVAPVLPTRDVPAALARYERLGFDVSVYDGGDFYGYASHGPCRCTCRESKTWTPKTTLVSVYVYVSDTDALHTEWSSSGVEGRFHQPADTEYGLREGAYVDPDGNLLRYGSPLP